MVDKLVPTLNAEIPLDNVGTMPVATGFVGGNRSQSVEGHKIQYRIKNSMKK